MKVSIFLFSFLTLITSFAFAESTTEDHAKEVALRNQKFKEPYHRELKAYCETRHNDYSDEWCDTLYKETVGTDKLRDPFLFKCCLGLSKADYMMSNHFGDNSTLSEYEKNLGILSSCMDADDFLYHRYIYYFCY